MNHRTTEAPDQRSGHPTAEDALSEISDFFNPPRVKIAAFLLARDEDCCTRPVPRELIWWADNIVKVGMTQEHSGDCTKESHACIRCIADLALQDADSILALAKASAESGDRSAADEQTEAR